MRLTLDPFRERWGHAIWTDPEFRYDSLKEHFIRRKRPSEGVQVPGVTIEKIEHRGCRFPVQHKPRGASIRLNASQGLGNVPLRQEVKIFCAIFLSAA